uniref:protein-serine/threonine phosphatase n=1 Tax=Araucaria cunninghamii TaxID=56994 RepID=A0A0D6R541_ARACU
MLRSCLNPLQSLLPLSSDSRDPMLWTTDIKNHSSGYLSMAVVQANTSMEDQSQVITGPWGSFVGVYDGHGGPQASRYLSHHLFSRLEKFVLKEGKMSTEVFRMAFSAIEEEFLHFVTRSWEGQPELVSTGSCCLVGVISNNMLYVASLGDSRAVLGSVNAKRSIKAERLSTEHNAAEEEVRKELKSLHPDDSHIVVFRNGVWRVKGIIQVSRSIGDIYLKKPEFNRDPLFQHFGFPLKIRRPVLSAEPSVHGHSLKLEDRFIIFASDGLWEQISEQEAAEIVYNNARTGIAKRLVRAALQVVAKKRDMKYAELQKIERGVRRNYHDDISVIVIYLDHEAISQQSSQPSFFNRIEAHCTSAPTDIFTSDGVEMDGSCD